MGDLFSGGGKTQTLSESSTESPPPYVVQAQQNLLGAGQDILGGFLNRPGYASVGVNPDMQTGYDLTRYVAQQAFTNKVPTTAGAAIRAPVSPLLADFTRDATQATPQYAGAAATANPTYGTAQMGRAAQTSGAEINGLMNPYLQNVLDPTLSRLRQDRAASEASFGAKMAAAGSFGGSREALGRAAIARDAQDKTAQTVSQLMAQGYDAASALAQANTQNRQQMELANVGAENSMRSANMNAANNFAQFNASNANDMARFNAGVGNQAGQFNAAAQNARDLAGSDYLAKLYGLDLDRYKTDLQASLQRPGIESSLLNEDQARKLSMIQSILGIGDAQRGIIGQNVAIPQTALQLYDSLIPDSFGGTKTGQKEVPKQGASGLGQGLGLIGSLVGALSDRRGKVDIAFDHDDPTTGVPIYSFRYATDPKHYPKVVGPMAQDLRESFPEAVVDTAGSLNVVASKLPASLARFYDRGPSDGA